MQYLWSFIIGGVVCAAAQILIDKTKLTPARILTGLVVAGAIVSAVGLYGPLTEFAGNGVTVPITGFGHSIINGVKKAIDESGFIGIFTGALTGTAGGITAAIVFSVIASLLFKLREK